MASGTNPPEAIGHNQDDDANSLVARQGEETATLPAREDAFALTVVGLGASAGGVGALQEFFENAPSDAGMAFVVVLHLSPEHESHLAEVIGRVTAMPVQQVLHPVKIEPNHIYVIPPSHYLSMDDGMLRLVEPDRTRGRRVVIDLFFRALAEAHGPQATAVVLSGAGADGTLGLRQIKEMGGLTIAQEPNEAEHEGMPRSAIATGMVDYVLPVREMARQVAAYWDASRQMRLPQEAAPSPAQREEGPTQETALRDILAHLRAQTGHDFNYYKRATVLRRIGRRLQVNGLDSLPAYVEYLRRHPAEVNDLLGDLLISVTQFFRDAEVWEALERDVIPRLFENRSQDETLRAWVCGCATGEEAYSLAILLAEAAARRVRAPSLQIFATDMDAEAVAQARLGLFPDTILADVAPERLRRWFTQQNGRYQIKKVIRESVLFTTHDVLRDTPFSRLDLVTCRNLLIYLTREAQERIFEIFHFALRPDGRLLLGQSEAVDGTSPLFTPTDKLSRIYMRRPIARPIPPIPAVPGRTAVVLPAYGAAVPLSVPLPGVGVGEENAAGTDLAATPAASAGGNRSMLSGELHRGLLELFAPPSVLIDQQHEIIHLSDRAGRFLRVEGGEPSTNLLRLVHPDLRIDLRTALYAAAQGQDQVRAVPVSFETGRPARQVRLTVRPVREPAAARGYYLVLFEELPGEVSSSAEADDANANAAAAPAAQPLSVNEVARQLEDEIARLQLQLRSTVEQYELSSEELKASNEELQAINEELRSASEELETSREELQSVNEELTTVNYELKTRVDEVSRVNGDLHNLLSSTNIATLFLDRGLVVQRYTPAVEGIFNIIPTDVGRPFAHLTHRLATDALPTDAEQVLLSLTPSEREVDTVDGARSFLVRVRPYRTPEDRIDGVVLVFIDITQRKEAEKALRVSEERFRLMVDGAQDYAMYLMDADRRIVYWSRGAERIFGWTEAEAIGQTGDIIFTLEDRAAGAPDREALQAAETGRSVNLRWHVRKDGTRLYMDGVLTLLPPSEPGGPSRGFVKIARDVTDQHRTREELDQTRNQLETRVAERTGELTGMTERRTELLRQIVTAQEDERRRISRELHDETGQELTGLILGIGTLRDRPNIEPAVKESLSRLHDMADELAHKVHSLAVGLRPTALDDAGLVEALRTYMEQWASRCGIAADLEASELGEERLPSEVETVIYRVVQEALTNIHKHALGVKTSGVILQRRANEVRAVIEDDGLGFEPEVDPESDTLPPTASGRQRLGIVGMRERAALVGGTVSIESTPGQGTTVYLRIPLPAAAQKP